MAKRSEKMNDDEEVSSILWITVLGCMVIFLLAFVVVALLKKYHQNLSMISNSAKHNIADTYTQSALKNALNIDDSPKGNDGSLDKNDSFTDQVTSAKPVSAKTMEDDASSPKSPWAVNSESYDEWKSRANAVTQHAIQSNIDDATKKLHKQSYAFSGESSPDQGNIRALREAELQAQGPNKYSNTPGLLPSPEQVPSATQGGSPYSNQYTPGTREDAFLYSGQGSLDNYSSGQDTPATREDAFLYSGRGSFDNF